MKSRLKLFMVLILCGIMFSSLQSTEVMASELIVNGDGESGTLEGWIDPDDCWSAYEGSDAYQGNYYIWPSRKAIQETYIYQDVAVSSDMKGTKVRLSAMLANYDQSPHDQATLILQLLDNNGAVIKEYSSTQRNPVWKKHSLNAIVPNNATVIRVKLLATRYVGSDNDAYFDAISLVNDQSDAHPVYITGPTEAASAGDTIQLVASNTVSSDPKDYIWSSSYDANATVDTSGLVTISSDLPEEDNEVWIYAEDKLTGMIGIYRINSKIANDKPDLQVEPTTEPKPGTGDEITDLIEVEVQSGNLLINGFAEDGMTAWIDKDNAWDTRAEVTPHEGKTFFWPYKLDLEHTELYQDVDISDYNAGTWMELGGWLANYDQSPHDQATLRLEFLNKKGKVLEKYQKSQRNPRWMRHVIAAEIPQGAVTARVSLVADRFVGSDNDAYFDELYLVALTNTYDHVYIEGKTEKVGIDKTLRLTANNGKTTKASSFEWFSSYDALATVDKNGLVTVHEEGEVVIYAKDKSTGITGSYYINSENGINETPAPDKVTGLKKQSVTKTAITLKWTKAEECSGYYVYQYDTAKKKYVKVKTITKATTTSIKISKLKKGTSYKFKVVAYRKYGGKVYTAPASKVITVKTTK